MTARSVPTAGAGGQARFSAPVAAWYERPDGRDAARRDDRPRAGPGPEITGQRPGPVPRLRLAPRPRPGALEREPERVADHALRRRRRRLQPSGGLLVRSLPEDRRALRERPPRGARRRGGPRAVARVPRSARPRPA